MTNKLHWTLILLAFLLLMGNAGESAPSAGLSGEASADAYFPTRESHGKNFTQLHSRLELQGDLRLSEPLSARAVYAADFFEGKESRLTGNRGGTHLEHELKEGWLEYFRGGWQLRAGQLILPWGKSDAINPTDFLSAKDGKILSHESERHRKGGLAFLMNVTPAQGSSPWSITLVLQPRFPESKVLVPPAALPAGITLEDTERPSVRPENTEVAAKLSYSGDGWDGSLSAFYGWNHKPEFAEIDHRIVATAAGPLLLARGTQLFRRIRAIGADASLSKGDWVYRLESAYTFTENNDGKNPTVLPSHWSSVLGLERPILERFRIQAQLLSKLYPRFTAPNDAGGRDSVSAALNRQIAAANALIHQYQEKWETAATLRVSYETSSSPFRAEILYYQSINGGDWYLQPLLSYGFIDNFRVYLGSDQYGGPGWRSLGSLRTYNSVFTEMKYAF